MRGTANSGPSALPPVPVEGWALPVRAPAAAARRMVRALLGSAGEGTVAAAELLACELVTNAERHARGTMFLRLSSPRPSVLRVAVTDEGAERPRMRPAEPTAEGGRGLCLVHALAERWGTDSLPEGGKVVWFELAL